MLSLLLLVKMYLMIRVTLMIMLTEYQHLWSCKLVSLKESGVTT